MYWCRPEIDLSSLGCDATSIEVWLIALTQLGYDKTKLTPSQTRVSKGCNFNKFDEALDEGPLSISIGLMAIAQSNRCRLPVMIFNLSLPNRQRILQCVCKVLLILSKDKGEVEVS